MPSLSAKINFLLGFGERRVEDETLLNSVVNAPDFKKAFLNLVPQNQTLNQPLTIFREFSQDEVAEWKQSFSG